jgi:hypothetical protein
VRFLGINGVHLQQRADVKRTAFIDRTANRHHLGPCFGARAIGGVIALLDYYADVAGTAEDAWSYADVTDGVSFNEIFTRNIARALQGMASLRVGEKERGRHRLPRRLTYRSGRPSMACSPSTTPQ